MLKLHIKKKLKEFSLDISFHGDQEYLGLLGASGSGKSMTLKCIAGIECPDWGYIILNDRVLFDSEKRINLPPRKRKVGYLFQNYALFPTMTVEENIVAGLKDKQERRTELERQLVRFQLTGLEKRFPSQLSGGQQQRTALARMFAHKPDIILLDEPFSALDGYLKEKLQHEMLQVLKEYGKEIILVSHSRDDIYRFCKKIVAIDAGRVLQEGSLKDIFLTPVSCRTARLTGCNNITAIEKINEYEIYAADWDLRLRTSRPVREQECYLGIRSHDICIPDRDGDNVFEMQLSDIIESPFEYKYHVSAVQAKPKAALWWKTYKNLESASRAVEFPCKLKIPKEKLLLLTE